MFCNERLITCFPFHRIMLKHRRPRLRRVGPLKQMLDQLSYPHVMPPRLKMADSFSVVAVVWNLIQEFLGRPPELRVAAFEDDPGTYDATVKVSHTGLQPVLQSRVLTGHNEIIMAIAMEGTMIITGSYDKTAKIWDALCGDLQCTLHCGSPVFAVGIEEEVAITGTVQGTTHVWDIHKLKLPMNCKLTEGSIWPRLTQDKNLDSDILRFSLEYHRAPVLALAKRGGTVATGAQNTNAYVWDIYRGQLSHILKGHSGSVEAVALHPNLQLMVTGSADATARLWNMSLGDLLQIFPLDTNVPQMCRTPTAGYFSYLRLLTQSLDSIVAVAMKDKWIAVVSAHGKVRIWDRKTGEVTVQDDGSNQCRQGVRGGVDMHEDGTVVVSWKSGTATIWDATCTTPQFVLPVASCSSAAYTENATCRAWIDSNHPAKYLTETKVDYIGVVAAA